MHRPPAVRPECPLTLPFRTPLRSFRRIGLGISETSQTYNAGSHASGPAATRASQLRPALELIDHGFRHGNRFRRHIASNDTIIKALQTPTSVRSELGKMMQEGT